MILYLLGGTQECSLEDHSGRERTECETWDHGREVHLVVRRLVYSGFKERTETGLSPLRVKSGSGLELKVEYTRMNSVKLVKFRITFNIMK